MRIAWDAYHVEPRLMGLYRWGAHGQVGWGGGVYDHLLWVVRAGEGQLRTAAGGFHLRRGSCVWFKPGVDFQVDQTRASLTMYAVVFALKDARGRDLPLGSDLPDDALDEPQPGFALAIARRLQDLASGTADGERSAFGGAGRHCAAHLLTGLLMELDRHNDRGAAVPPPRLTPAQATVYRLSRATADDPAAALSVTEQARIAGVTPTHLCRIYRQLFRRTPGSFARMFRIRHAQRLLVESDLELGAIAEGLGYSSLAFFSRQFKQQVGLAPSAFRRRFAVAGAGSEVM